MSHQHDEALRKRGILDAANDALWTADDNGWRYPVYNMAGQHYTNGTGAVYRWKNLNSSASPKYLWKPGKPDRIRYYLLPDTKQAIQDASGVVYLASGEPDVLAYRAAGIRNTLCWFGENSMPDTFPQDMEMLGVGFVYLFPDLDDAGMQMAANTWRVLSDSNIDFICRRIPGEMGSKHDINWLWIERGFNINRFKATLMEAQEIDETTLELEATRTDAPAKPVQSTLPTEGALPEKFAAAIISDVEGRISKGSKWKSDGWSQNFPCVNPAGHSDGNDSHPSAGFNREKMAYKCHTCGSCNAKQYGEYVGIRIADYIDKPATIPGGQKPDTERTGQSPVIEPLPPLYEDSHTANLLLLDELRDRRKASVEPMSFPFATFHQFGGFAEMMWPGKLVYIAGVSGGGKTSLGESFYEVMMRNGDDCVWYGPEWSAEEMRARALQRAGGLTLTQLGKLRAWRHDMDNGIPEGKRRGAPPGAGELEHSISLLEYIDTWPGKAYYLKQDASLNSMQAIIDTVEGLVEDKRSEGRKVKALFFDYLQRAPKAGRRGWDWSEEVVSQIKALCERKNLFGFIFIQPTKGASAATREGDMLTEATGQGISDQQSNLYLTMTPKFEERKIKAPFVRFNIVKNSMGKTGSVNLKWAQRELAIVDEEYDERYELAGD